MILMCLDIRSEFQSAMCLDIRSEFQSAMLVEVNISTCHDVSWA